MQLANETLAVLWLGAGAVVLWMLLPAVLNALGLSLRRSVIEDNPSAVEPTGDDAEYADLVGQLRRLGFEPVLTKIFAGAWLKTLVAIERTIARSSTTPARFGRQ